MRVCLIDVDSKIPNVALMKLATYHRGMGDDVKLGYDPEIDRPHLAYASKVFDFTPEPERMPDCPTVKGGPGYDLTATIDLPDYERLMPDYSLYPAFDYAIGRFTRGCPNRCPWCIVPKMDGNQVRHVADLSDFWAGQKVVRLLDDNIMADADEFCRACRQLERAGVQTIWDALDIRLIDDKTASALASVKHAKRIHFSWDGHSQDDAVPRGVETLARHGLKPWRLVFYVLVGFNTTPEYDMHRITELQRLGANPFVMPYDRSDPYQHHLARWCNNKVIFKSTTFDEYEPWKRSGGGGLIG